MQMLSDMLFPVPGNSRNTAISKMWRHKCLSLPNIIARLEMGTVQILLKPFKFRLSLPVSLHMLSECWNNSLGGREAAEPAAQPPCRAAAR